MEAVAKAIGEDVKAAAMAFESEDFDNMNIFANRIMANAIFSTENNNLFLVGFFLKDIAFVYGSLKVSKQPTAFSTAKSLGSTYVQKLSKDISKTSSDENKLWQEFYDFCNDLRKFQMNEFEEKTYTENHEFTRHSFKWLVEYLEKKKETLFEPNNKILKGTLNEMERIFRVHGGELGDLFVLSLIRALDRYYDYFHFAHKTPEGHVNKEKVKDEVFPYIHHIHQLILTSQLQASKVDTVLSNITKCWREFFIDYMELPRPTIAIEKGIRIPEETKEKLTKTLTKALEKEIGVGKK